jgi:formylglycine-generating enzyme required for sulfatase activity
VAGNAWEWVVVAKQKLDLKTGEPTQIIRGGSYTDSPNYCGLQARLPARGSLHNVGFRVCRSLDSD